MDRSASAFTSVASNLKQVDHTDILNENETQTAKVRLKKTATGLVGRLDFDDPNKRFVSLRERTVEVYAPKSQAVQIYDIGKFGPQFDQFLLLGFGTSGKELQKNYTVKLIGDETVAGKPATHVLLTPKTKEAREYFQTLEMWVAQGGTVYPVQEKVHKNDKDYVLITYSDVKLNAPITDKELELAVPPGVKRVPMNK